MYMADQLAANIANSFYAATFPSLVYNLPKIIDSEKEVKAGTKTYVEARCKTLTSG